MSGGELAPVRQSLGSEPEGNETAHGVGVDFDSEASGQHEDAFDEPSSTMRVVPTGALVAAAKPCPADAA